MPIRLIATALLAIFISGCATTGENINIQLQQLQGRINYLETELKRKEQEINTLEDRLERAQEMPRVSPPPYKEEAPPVQLSARQIQTALKNAGFYKGAVDGKAGVRTKEAIKAFQKSRGLKADGVVGKKTSLELQRYLKK